MTNRGSHSPAVKLPVSSKAVEFDKLGGIKGLFRTWARAVSPACRRNGAAFTDAHHRLANTETIVGHTTLATEADPVAHGMVGSVWFDRRQQNVSIIAAIVVLVRQFARLYLTLSNNETISTQVFVK